jgi:Ca2+-binding RTX toxin-like protein
MPTNNLSFTEATFLLSATPDGYNELTIGDFNGDGQPDTLLPNRNSKNAAVLLSDGKGGFNAEATIAWDPLSSSPIISDINNDGKADLVSIQNNAAAVSVSVVLGNGSGGFSAPTTFATTTVYANSMVVDDFNGDNKADVFVSSGDNAILLGNGDGSFKASTKVEGNFGTVKVADFNGDNKRDIIGINRTSISLTLGKGDGSFESQTTFAIEGLAKDAFLESIAVGDFNSDGKPDLIVGTSSFTPKTDTTPAVTTSGVSVLLNNGSGGFSTKTSFATAEDLQSIAVGDFNGDGKADIVTSEISPSSDAKLTGTFVRLNDGSGGFSSPTQVSSSWTKELLVGDFNKDGKSDLAGFVKDKVGTILLSVPDPKPLPTPAPAAPVPAAPIGTTATPLTPIVFKKSGKGKGLIVKGNVKKTKLVGKKGNDRITGSKKNDRLMGNAGDDLLNGGAGNDKAIGGAGNDVLVGGKGKDMLTGGAGRDTFVFNMVSDGMDQISDFEVGQDLIDLRGIFQQAAFQKAGSNFDRFQQFVKVEQMGAIVKVSIDADGVGAGTAFTQLAMLNGATAPVNSQSFIVG